MIDRERWGERIAAVVRLVPETEGFEGGYEAVTMTGVPHGVSVIGSDPNSAEGTSDHLLDGLKAFGFTGYVAGEDTTYFGSVQRYEVAVG